MTPLIWQWLLVAVFGLAFLFSAPLAKTVAGFFSATAEDGKQPGVFLLTSSLVISWIFAKSITNAANLGLDFGLVGGVAYAAYYGSFVVAGVVLYQLRTKGGWKSIHEFLASKFGHVAVLIFSLLVGFRLYNEVWSNTMVIGSYFGEVGTSNYYWSILVFTGLTLAYTLKGGLRSSLLTDAIQMVLFGVLLFIVLGIVIPDTEGGLTTYVQAGEWSFVSGINLLFVALIQIFSYPFHDSVMTDRGFISDPATTRKSFFLAAVIGFFCILLFSFVGIYAKTKGLSGQAAVEVSKILGVAAMLVMNFIMITSAASTLDSAFASAAKLFVMDLGKPENVTVKRGRLVMVLFAVAGTLPIFFNPEILSATTVSGTMVLGLAPVFLFWNSKAGPWSFYLAVGSGIVFGLTLAMGLFPEDWVWFPGKYGDLLTVNILGTLVCFTLFFIPMLIRSNARTAH